MLDEGYAFGQAARLKELHLKRRTAPVAWRLGKMGGGDLNLKKSWHPLTRRNLEIVWELEQEQKKEKQKVEQLKKEKEQEREKDELRRIYKASGKERYLFIC